MGWDMKKIILLLVVFFFCFAGLDIPSDGGPYATLDDDNTWTGDNIFHGLFVDMTGYPSDVGVTIKADTSQTANTLEITDSSDNPIFQVRAAGSMINTGGLITTSAQYGSGLFSFNYGEDTPARIANVGSYDHTGGVQEKLFTKTSGADFDSNDVGRWILLTGVNVGAVAEIKTVLTTTTCIVDGMGWTGDLVSQTFNAYEHPAFITGAGNKHEFSVGASGEFEVISYDFINSKMVEIELDSAADNQRAIVTEVEAHGYNNIVGHEIIFETGDLGVGESVAGMYVHSNLIEATSADSTTTVPCYIAGSTDDSDAESKGFLVLAGMDTALQVYGAVASDPEYGYEVTSGTVVDRVNSGGGGNDAFKNASVNVQIMDNDDDYILIGSSSTFEIVNVALAIKSSKDCDLDFFYSTGVGTWSTLTVTDSTDELSNLAGSWVFTAPGDWAVSTQAEGAGDITSGYYIKVQRTYSTTIPTLPTESHFKTFATRAAGMSIKGSGSIVPAHITADPCTDTARFPEGSIFYNATDNLPCFCNESTTARDMIDDDDCF